MSLFYVKDGEVFIPEAINPDIKDDVQNGTVDINWMLESKANDQVEFSIGYGQTGGIGRYVRESVLYDWHVVLPDGIDPELLKRSENVRGVRAAEAAAQAAGQMDASFFLFFEETEWYFRHNLAGFKTVFCPEARVYHERSMTTVRYSPLKLFYSERNRLRSAIRLLPLGGIAMLPVRGFVRYLNMAKGGVPGQSGDGKKLSKVSICKALAKAWLQALLSFPKEWAVRKQYERQYGIVTAKVRKLLAAYPLQEK